MSYRNDRVLTSVIHSATYQSWIFSQPRDSIIVALF